MQRALPGEMVETVIRPGRHRLSSFSPQGEIHESENRNNMVTLGDNTTAWHLEEPGSKEQGKEDVEGKKETSKPTAKTAEVRESAGEKENKKASLMKALNMARESISKPQYGMEREKMKEREKPRTSLLLPHLQGLDKPEEKLGISQKQRDKSMRSDSMLKPAEQGIEVPGGRPLAPEKVEDKERVRENPIRADSVLKPGGTGIDISGDKTKEEEKEREKSLNGEGLDRPRLEGLTTIQGTLGEKVSEREKAPGK